jgi:hypothetical protein
MKGEPIPGEHWVEIDLLNPYNVSSFVLDWEVAYSNAWSVQVFNDQWVVLSFAVSQRVASTQR